VTEKHCLICGATLIQRAREPNVRFAERQGCGRSHAAMIGKRRVMEMKIEAVTLDAEWGIAIQFPASADPGDGGFIKLRRDATHVHYETSASWGAI
jgi:hypothetical protein